MITSAALDPPRAHGPPLPLARFKVEPEDFRVEEQLSFTPSGAGPHWLLRIEKRGANTPWVAGQLARLGGVRSADVGYAGLKDRHAVAVQWFSVPADGTTAAFWNALHSAEFQVLEVVRNSRKLQRGALTGNRFRIRLRRTGWSREQLEAKLRVVRAHGVPNYFGPQRFGRDADNLQRARDWIASGLAPRGRAERGFALSAARALLFNAVLARRVIAGDWAQLAPGDIASLEGSGSHFPVTTVDEALRQRLLALDVHPSGPLWGRGEPHSLGEPRRYEDDVARDFSAVAALLAAQGLVQERRSLRCVVHDLAVLPDAAEQSVSLAFTLGRGQFATTVLREVCDLAAE